MSTSPSKFDGLRLEEQDFTACVICGITFLHVLFLYIIGGGSELFDDTVIPTPNSTASL